MDGFDAGTVAAGVSAAPSGFDGTGDGGGAGGFGSVGGFGSTGGFGGTGAAAGLTASGPTANLTTGVPAMTDLTTGSRPASTTPTSTPRATAGAPGASGPMPVALGAANRSTRNADADEPTLTETGWELEQSLENNEEVATGDIRA